MHISSSLENMIKQQLKTGHVVEPSILNLFEKFPREVFVPEAFKHVAYSDLQITLPHHQKMMTPLEEALIIQGLQLTGKETILEIGTGTGYFTALLSQLCKKVISIDYYPDFTKQAQKKLERYHCNNVELLTGDASKGWIDQAPYDVVVYTAALPKLNQTHQLQIMPGGKLFALIGQRPAIQGILLKQNLDGNWSDEILFETDLPYLLNTEEENAFIF